MLKLIVGLGNPGQEYENTRHNIGFQVLDSYCSGTDFQKKFDGLIKIMIVKGEKVLFLKPQTFMNLSGQSVIKAMKYYDIDIVDVLVIQDDLDLALGSYKMKTNSSSGGHNGIKSIIAHLKSENFARLKIGIAHDHKNKDTISYVLGKFSKEESKILEENRLVFNSIIDVFIQEGVQKAIQVANSR